MEVQAIVEKLRKLQALTRSSNEHEAELAAAKMQELMTAHRISELQLAGAEHRDEGYSRQDYSLDPGLWRKILLDGICRANGARVVDLRDDRVAVVARPGSLPMIVETYQYLADTIDRLARDGWAAIRGQSYQSGRTWLNDFRMGATKRIRERIRDAANAAAGTGATAALIVRDDQAADAAQRAEFPHLTRRSVRRSYGAGYAAGWSAGGAVGLGPTRKVGQGYRLTAGS